MSPKTHFRASNKNIEWLNSDATAVESPLRPESDIVDVFWPSYAVFVAGEPLCDLNLYLEPENSHLGQFTEKISG